MSHPLSPVIQHVVAQFVNNAEAQIYFSNSFGLKVPKLFGAMKAVTYVRQYIEAACVVYTAIAGEIAMFEMYRLTEDGKNLSAEEEQALDEEFIRQIKSAINENSYGWPESYRNANYYFEFILSYSDVPIVPHREILLTTIKPLLVAAIVEKIRADRLIKIDSVMESPIGLMNAETYMDSYIYRCADNTVRSIRASANRS